MTTLISKLPEPYRSQAIVARASQDRDEDCDVLSQAFSWVETREGWDYWHAINESRIPNPLPTDPRIAELERRVAELEGLVIPPAAPVCDDVTIPRTPPVPLPEGFVRWENRGFGWRPKKRVCYITYCPSGDSWDETPEFASTPLGFSDLEYFEAVKDEPASVNPGEGYRLVVEGELIEAGDEEASSEAGGWSLPVGPRAVGEVFRVANWFPVRRKIKPTVYRLLNLGEIVRDGDEILDEINLGGPERWRLAASSRGERYDPEDHYVTRRRVSSFED